MTTQTEALKLALEALKTAQNNLAPSRGSAHAYGDGELWDQYAEAITAIKEALAQPEQLEVLQLVHKADIDLAKKRATEAQPEQPKVRTGDCLLVGVCASEGHKIQKAQPEHEKYCPICQGVGQVDTGIMESPVTICNACNGTGLKANPEQEPVAWLSKGGKGIWFHKPDDESLGAIPLYTAPSRCPNCDSLERQNAELDLRLAEQDQAPFGFLTNKRQRFNFEPNATGLSNMPMTIDWKIPLYGAPQPQRKPLTGEQIDAIASSVRKADTPESVLIRLSRAIEAAHGIKE